VPDQRDAFRLDSWIGAQPAKSGLDVFGEAGHRCEPVVVAATVAASVKEERVHASGLQEWRNWQHQICGAVPSVDDEHSRAWSVVHFTSDKPSSERAAVRSRNRDVVGNQFEVRRPEVNCGPSDAKDSSENPRQGEPNSHNGYHSNSRERPNSACPRRYHDEVAPVAPTASQGNTNFTLPFHSFRCHAGHSKDNEQLSRSLGVRNLPVDP
jgi:hypothetical protein